MSKILVVNAGSSSLKWSLHDKEDLHLIASGLCERINLDGRIITKYQGEKFIDEVTLPNHTTAVKELIKLWAKYDVITDLNTIAAIGFRTPFSGHKYLTPAFFTDEVREGIEEAKKFIPLHAPATLAAVEAFNENIPSVKKIIAQDTAFHVTVPKINATFSINQEWAEKYHVYKYGYHGLSHDFINNKMKSILGKDKNNLIIAHLGSGSSVCAVKDSKSFDISVGFSSSDGLIMGTRAGTVDPLIYDFLVRVENNSAQEVFDMFVKQSGLLGISGISNDIRDLHAACAEGNEKAQFAVDMFVWRVVDTIAAYINKIGEPIDAIVFTAGIGENDEIVRKSVIEKLPSFGVKLDEEKNLEKYGSELLISTKDSKIPVYKVRTDEEIVIARYVKEMI
ncbi:acetate/propionate family kinase [Mycoplasma phocoenae]|uniref:Acetate kinase n=1 Tax=Mycoplasma phocoenae TaxID=754517 RepID=A0A858U364_9MOLU|nr:acetate/propionate family kinase [Mycoplasma phocoenae]QJG66862.1 acetate/propionate family kinase [Mycoplasma phocoenae]